MKSLKICQFANPDEVRVQTEPLPIPNPGEVAVRIRAAGVNPADWYVVNGMFQLPPALPFTPGFEAAGEIIGLGEGVSQLQMGQRILMTLPYLRNGVATFGVFAEQAIVPATNVVLLPDGIEWTTAAAVPVMYGTAYVALKHRAQLQAGETLLVTGATGATGSAAVQIGKHLGAKVIAVSSGEAKLQRVKVLGADLAIDYKQGDWAAAVRAATDGKGVNVAFETVGGDIFEAVVNSMASEGRLLPIGMASGVIPELSMIRVLAGNFAIVGTDFANYTLNHVDLVQQGLAEVLSWHQEEIFQDLQVKTVGLEEAAAAIDRVHKGAGAKVVVVM